MVQAAPEDPPRSTHQEILEDEHARLDHAHDILLRYRRIVENAHVDIDRGIFTVGSKVREVVDAIMTDVLETTLEDGCRGAQ